MQVTLKNDEVKQAVATYVEEEYGLTLRADSIKITARRDGTVEVDTSVETLSTATEPVATDAGPDTPAS